MAKYFAICVLSLLAVFSSCSKKSDEPQKPEPVINPPKADPPTFDFTVTIGTITDSSVVLTVATTGAKQSDVLKYSVNLNGKVMAENQQTSTYIVKGLTAETNYDGKIDLKDQLGNVKSKSVNFRTAKYFLRFDKSYEVVTRNQGDCFIQTKDGGYVISGFASTGFKEGVLGNSYNNEYITLVKTDKFGNKIWSNNFTYDSRFSIGHTKHNVVELADGGFVVNGSSAIVKVDANGNKLWEHYFPRTGFNLLIRNIYLNKDNTIMVCGYGEDGALIYKFSSSGQLIWENHFFENNLSPFTTATSIVETADNGFIVIGEYAQDYIQSYFAKLDDKGNVVWKKRFPVSGSSSSVSVKATGDGTYTILTHVLEYRPRLTKITLNGEELMSTLLNVTRDFRPTGFDFTPDGYILSGIYVPPFVTVNNYWMLIKTDKQAGVTWQTRYGAGHCWDVKYIDDGFIASGGNGYFETFQMQLMKLDKDGK